MLAFFDALAQQAGGAEIGGDLDPPRRGAISLADFAQSLAQAAGGKHMHRRCTGRADRRAKAEHRQEQRAQKHRMLTPLCHEARCFQVGGESRQTAAAQGHQRLAGLMAQALDQQHRRVADAIDWNEPILAALGPGEAAFQIGGEGGPRSTACCSRSFKMRHGAQYLGRFETMPSSAIP